MLPSPRISVIIPVYNTEKCLHRCINSILTQTFTDFELLLIDDGSKDSSSKICDEYAAKDSRVRVFHKENGGVSSARNLGLDNARGEWITFVDSDDWIDQDSLESTITITEKIPDADIIRFGYHKETDDSRIIKQTCEQDLIISSSKEMLITGDKFSFYGFVWNTLYKRIVIGELRFIEELNWLEDHIFTYKYLGKCKLMYVLSKPLYHYSYSSIGGLSNIKDANIIKHAAEEEFSAISLIAGVKDAINGYHGKLKMAISILYKHEKQYYKRYEFYKRFTLLPQSIGYKDLIIGLYNNRYIPFFIKDFIMKVKIKKV